jgi:uncharacterized Zn finger protein
MGRKMSLTWWGRDFITALEGVTDAGRLQRGRAYSTDQRLLQFSLNGDQVRAVVRGNKNPYFGVYVEPEYQVKIELKRLNSKEWQQVIDRLAANAGWLTRLLQGEVPEGIDEAFAGSGIGLLPASGKELKASCDCPDYANPCKHIAGVYYRIATLLDHDPFLLFQLRGISQTELQKRLATTPLGQALAGRLAEEPPPPELRAALFPETPLQQTDGMDDYRHFWRGGPLPAASEEKGPRIPAIAIRREGERPPFWQRENPFIEAMSELYLAVGKRGREQL